MGAPVTAPSSPTRQTIHLADVSSGSHGKESTQQNIVGSRPPCKITGRQLQLVLRPETTSRRQQLLFRWGDGDCVVVLRQITIRASNGGDVFAGLSRRQPLASRIDQSTHCAAIMRDKTSRNRRGVLSALPEGGGARIPSRHRSMPSALPAPTPARR